MIEVLSTVGQHYGGAANPVGTGIPPV